MPTTPTPPATRLAGARWPGDVVLSRSRGDDGLVPMRLASIQAMARDQIEMDTGLRPFGDTALLLAEGSSISLTAYHFDVAAGVVSVGGVLGRIAADTDAKFVGTTPDITTYALDGSVAAVLADPDTTAWIVLVAILVNGAVELRGILGDAAADSEETEPTPQEIRDALEAANISGADLDAFGAYSRVKIQRVSGSPDTITTTVTAGTDAALSAERARGYSLAATSS